MKINKLYTQYAQKSKIFLYPMLGIKRGSSVTPINTYLNWVDKYDYKDQHLICTYHLRDDSEFKSFEKRVLLGHSKFSEFYYGSDNKGIYVFNFADENELFSNVLKGKYSKLEKNQKSKILDFFSNNRASMTYIDSFLNPEKYFKDYSKILDVSEELLKSVGELCEHPDFEKEKFTEKEVTLKMIDYI
jgi:hypothetical protein